MAVDERKDKERLDHQPTIDGQWLTFPFPFVHQQPHDCGNKTINRWETSLWNLSYNLSAVNLVSLSTILISHGL